MHFKHLEHTVFKRRHAQLLFQPLLFLFAMCVASPGLTGEEVLKGRLMSPVSTGVDIAVHTPIENIGFKVGNPTGYVFFEDGRIAQKQWVFAQTNFNGVESGLFTGFAMYVFEDGDSLTLAHNGSWDSNGLAGKYTDVVRGTGKYENAIGTGSYIAINSPWKQTEMLEIILRISTGK